MEGGARALSIEEAATSLRAGELVGLPTETVYGLAADALDPAAVGRIFSAKGRPRNHPLIVHVADLAMAEGWVSPGILARADVQALAGAFWPGPLTLVLPRGPLAHDAVTGGLATVGLRVPAHPQALAVLRAFGSPLAAPSANRYGHVSPTAAAHVAADLGGAIAGVVDGGPCEVGIESTILDLTREPPEVLRHGGVPREALEAALGRPLVEATVAEGGAVRAPGMVASHYAPRARLEVVTGEALATRAGALRAAGQQVAVIATSDLGADADAWARSLYRVLRETDAAGPEVILIPSPPAGRLAAGLADRLRRATSTR
jgi:L-threonylcarbamoyladenylate synthase